MSDKWFALCPQCKRTVGVHESLFGDKVYNTHMMAAYSDESQAEISADYRPGANHAVSTINKIRCPMSGQAVE